MEKIRLQKIIADSGYCSRRRAEQYIQNGEVKVNGRPVSVGDKADPKNDLITVNGEKIPLALNFSKRQREILLAGGTLNYTKNKG